MKSQQHGPIITFACLVLALVALGCASTKVTDQHRLVHEWLPRPANIWVHEFAATPAEVPADATLAREFTVDTTPQTPEQIEEARQLGRGIAAQLVQQIRDLGLPAQVATGGGKPRVNDLVIRGYLVSVEEGSAAKRVVLGFGAGGSALCTAVEGFQVTPTGLRKLGYGAVQAGGNKTPGAAVGVATFIATANPAGLIVSTGAKIYGEASGKSTIEGRAKATAKEIAKVLEARFQEQGWIK
ncbi:MAG: hypothetical protein PCFJNLEI_02552 [Verrucomicrobiae bacterium]|nr:hypothetical protein [Verrucomicrobiae bacterium]